MWFGLMCILFPVITACLYRTGYMKGILSSNEHINQAMWALLSIVWPLGLLVLLIVFISITIIVIGTLAIDVWIWVATGKWPEKLEVRTGKKKTS